MLALYDVKDVGFHQIHKLLIHIYVNLLEVKESKFILYSLKNMVVFLENEYKILSLALNFKLNIFHIFPFKQFFSVIL